MQDPEVDPDIARQDTMLGVTEEMGAAGFGLPQPPDFPMPLLRPADLTCGDQALYGQKYVQFAAWESYSYEVRAHIRGWIIEYTSKLERIGVKARIKARRMKSLGEKMSEKSIEDGIEGSTLYMEIADKLQVLRQKNEIVEAQWKKAEVGRALYSRYLPIREGERRTEGNRRF